MSDPDAVTGALTDALTPGRVFWDVGAYEGRYSTLAAEAGATVHAFEPNPEVYDTLCERVPERVTCHSVALADAPGHGRLVNDGDHDSTHRLDAGVSFGETRLETVDRLVADGLPAPDVLKVDVEGAEADVLRGARETLTSAMPTVVVEIHAATVAGPGLAGYGDAPATVRDLLGWAGYAVEQFTEGERTYHLRAVGKP